MDLGIRGKRALVTGAGRGIGASVAMNLAKEGVKVAISSRTKADLQELLQAMGGEKKGHVMIAQDLTEEGAPAKVMKKLNKVFGPLDILVNNVGSTLEIKDPFCSLKAWREIYRINFEVAVEFTNLVVPYMREQGWGRIVNMSSTAGMENNGPVTYCSMKAALTAYSRSLGRVLAKEGIVVSAVIAGAIFTKGGSWDKVMVTNPEHVRKYLADRCPMGKFGEPDDIGTMVTMLCSKQAKFCQGSIVPVDGGQSRHYFWTRDD